MKKTLMGTLALIGLVSTFTLSAPRVLAEEVKENGNIYYIVEPGDTLSEIGERYSVGYPTIQGNNADQIENANLIFVGQKFLVGGGDFKADAYVVSTQPPIIETQTEYVEEAYVEETYEEPAYVAEETYVAPAPQSTGGIAVGADGAPLGGTGVLNRVDGVNVNASGVYETYYSQKVLAGGGLNIPGRHVGEYQTVRDGDGYIVLASDIHAKGAIVESSLGTGKVYDTGTGHGGIDVYVNW